MTKRHQTSTPTGSGTLAGAIQGGAIPGQREVETMTTTTEITVRRPDGTVETVTKDMRLTDALFEQAKRQTREAGRGELLSYRVIETEAPQVSQADRERAEIATMFDAAENLRDYPGRFFPALRRAQDALDEWRERYPAAAAAEETVTESRRQERKDEHADAITRALRGAD